MKAKLNFCLVMLVVLAVGPYSASAQTVHRVNAGEGTLQDAIDAAVDGDIIELVDGGGIYAKPSSDKTVIDKSLTIRAKDGLEKKPVIRHTNLSAGSARLFEIQKGGNLILQNLDLDGRAADGGAAHAKNIVRSENVAALADSFHFNLKIEDCILHNARETLVRIHAKTMADTLIFNNCIFDESGREAILLRESTDEGSPKVEYVEINNCTFTKIARQAFYAEYNDPVVKINHCTFDSISYLEDRRIIYPKDLTKVEIKNCIFTNQLGNKGTSVELYGNSSISFCDTFNVGTVKVNDNATIGAGMFGVDPQYTDPANDDYTLPLNSPVIGMADDGFAMGDLRWDPTAAAPTVHQVAAGTDMLKPVVEAAEDGDVIELVTSGGLYYETSSISIEGKSLTIRAREGLAQKPMIQNDDYGESNGVFRIKSGGSLTLKGVEFFNAKHLIRVDNDSSHSVVKIDDCYGHTANETLVKLYPNSLLDSLIITNSIFRDAEKEGIYLKELNTFGYAEFENCTFIHIGREAIRARYNDTAVLRINHCTFDSISYNSNYRAIYPEGVQDVEIKNTIITNKLGTHSDAVRIFGNSSIHHVDIFNAGGIDLEDSATTSDTLFVDPLYLNPAVDDYRLANNSPCRGVGDDGRALGDLRWETSPDQFRLSLATEGNGVVTADPAGGWYAPGTVVTLTATPDNNWKVGRWEGVPVFPPDSETATVTMDSDKEIKVVFVPRLEKYVLNVTTIGVGHVDLNPAPLDAEAMTYYEGTDVTLTAVSDTSSMAFSAWSGDATGSDNPVTVTVNADMNVTATFVPVVTQFTLDVEIVGLGTVALDPEPYADYSTYDSSTVVKLIAEPNTGLEFGGWSGDATGAKDTLIVQMDADLAITATFTEIAVTGGAIQVDTTWVLEDAVDFVRNNTQVDTIILTTGGGVYPAHDYISVDTDLTIMAQEGLEQRPKIEGNPDLNYSSGVFQIKRGGSSLTLKGLEIYQAKYQVRTDDDTLNTKIMIDDCYIHDAGEIWVKVYLLSFVDSLIITNSIFRECGKEGVYLRDPNTVNYVKLENSTFIHCGREALRMRDNENAVVRINHCNFDSTDWANDYRVIYPEGVQDVVVKNSIITNQLFVTQRHKDFLRIYGNSTASHILTYNASNNIDLEENATVDEPTIWAFDPLYEDSQNRNYTLLPESHAYGLADDGEALGDLKWATNEPTHAALVVVVDGNGTVQLDPQPVGMTYDPQTVVTLTAVPDSGYKFVEWMGDVIGTDNPVVLTMDAAKSVTAKFEQMTGVESLANTPAEYRLDQNYPNPFNPKTTVKFALKKAGHTTIKLYDVLGREVLTLVDRELDAGHHKVILLDPTLASGIYFYRIKSSEFTAIKKMTLMK